MRQGALYNFTFQKFAGTASHAIKSAFKRKARAMKLKGAHPVLPDTMAYGDVPHVKDMINFIRRSSQKGIK